MRWETKKARQSAGPTALAQVLMQQGKREAARDLLGTAIRLAEETDDSSVLKRANKLVQALDAD